jgi:cytochrome c-type biogenesis protein CcmH
MNVWVGLFVLLLIVLAPVVPAKEAMSLAQDPLLEKRVNEISVELRCLVCQNQTIADSNAELAVDLKNQVRDMVKSGQTHEQIVDYMVQRYGDFVLYRPPVKASTYLLWTGPFLLLVIGLAVLITNLRKRGVQMEEMVPLSGDETERLRVLLEPDTNYNKNNKESGL